MNHNEDQNGKFRPLSDRELRNLLKLKKEIENSIENDTYQHPPFIKDMYLYIDGYPESCLFHLN